MFKKNILKSLMLVLLVVLTACSSKKEDNADLKELNVQFVPFKTSETIEAQAKPLADLLSKELGIPVKVSISTDYTTIIEAMSSKKVDIGIMPPNSYILAHEQGAATAILQALRADVKQPGGILDTENLVSDYQALVIVKSDSGIKSLKDLKGKTIAAQDVVSASGYVFPVAEMIDAGLDIDKDVEIITTKGIDTALMSVLNGDADAAFVFNDGRNLLKKDIPDVFDKLSIAYTTKARIPNDAIAIREGISDEWNQKITDAFLKISESKEGSELVNSLYSHAGYVKADDSSFDIVREYGKKVGQ